MTSQYEELLGDVLANGANQGDRTGTGTRSVFGRQMRFDLSEGFPLVTTKKVFTRGIVAELLWMLSGDTNIKALTDQNVRIWDEWADENGNLGPVYGRQWRSWPRVSFDMGHAKYQGEIDQIADVLKGLRDNPDGRRHIVTAWNPNDINDMALPPCHMMFQFYVANGKLSCQLYQRSADMFLGVPFNIASYALLTHMFAQQLDLEAGEFVWTGGDCHVYNNHIEQVETQLKRIPYEYPTLILNKAPSLFEYKPEDVLFMDYQHHPAIKGEVSV